MTLTAEKPKVEIVPLKVTQTVLVGEVSKLYKAVKLVCDEAFALKVTNLDTSDRANLIAPKVKKGRKAIDELRKNILKDPKEFTNTVNKMFKPMLEVCDGAIRHLNAERDTFDAEQRRKQAEAEAEVRKEELRRQKISAAKGGTGENIKEVERPAQPQTADKVSRIPDLDRIQEVINTAAKKLTIPEPITIAGVSIWAEFNFKVTDPQALPDEYKKNSYRG